MLARARGLLFGLLIALSTAPLAGAAQPRVESCDAAPGRVWNISTVDDDGTAGSFRDQQSDPLYGTTYRHAVQGRVFEAGGWRIRFRVFHRSDRRSTAVSIAGVLERLYCYHKTRLAPEGAYLGQSALPGSGSQSPIPVYLDEAHSGGGIERPGALYLLRPADVKNRVELFREVAHEYAHLTVPGVRGFALENAAEDWNNGYLGELLYGTWFGEDEFAPDNASIREWSSNRSNALMHTFLRVGPASVVGLAAEHHFWEFIGMLLYVERVYGLPVLARALAYTRLEGREFCGQFSRTLADAMRVAAPERWMLPGDLYAPLPGASDSTSGNLRTSSATALQPDRPVRTWVFLTTGANGQLKRFKLRLDSPASGWKVRVAQIGRGNRTAVLGQLSPTAPEVAVTATADGWYLYQWRNLGEAPLPVDEWSWSRTNR